MKKRNPIVKILSVMVLVVGMTACGTAAKPNESSTMMRSTRNVVDKSYSAWSPWELVEWDENMCDLQDELTMYRCTPTTMMRSTRNVVDKSYSAWSPWELVEWDENMCDLQDELTMYRCTTTSVYGSWE